MAQAAERMNTLIEDLLAYSHVSRGASQLERVDMNHKMQKVLEDLEHAIEQKDATVTVDSLITITVPTRQMQQLFQNLITNALKYSKPDVPLQIHITSKPVQGCDVKLLRIGGEA